MRAAVGDWLLVKSHTAEQHARRAQIIGVGPDGAPPYTVHWIDDDRPVLMFPDPDAEVITSERLAELDRLQARQIVNVQSSIRSRRDANRP